MMVRATLIKAMQVEIENILNEYQRVLNRPLRYERKRVRRYIIEISPKKEYAAIAQVVYLAARERLKVLAKPGKLQ